MGSIRNLVPKYPAPNLSPPTFIVQKQKFSIKIFTISEFIDICFHLQKILHSTELDDGTMPSYIEIRKSLLSKVVFTDIRKTSSFLACAAPYGGRF